MRRSFAGTVEATMLAAYAADLLQARTQGLASPMKTDPHIILSNLQFFSTERGPYTVKLSLSKARAQGSLSRRGSCACLHGVLQCPTDRANLPNCLDSGIGVAC
jgi:hypothetical protein